MATTLLILAWVSAVLGIAASNISSDPNKVPFPVSLLLKVKVRDAGNRTLKSSIIVVSLLVLTAALGLGITKENSIQEFLSPTQFKRILAAHRELQAGRIEDRIRERIPENREQLKGISADDVISMIFERIGEIRSESKSAVSDVQYADVLEEFPAPSAGKQWGFIPGESSTLSLLDWFESVEGNRIWVAYKDALEEYLPNALSEILKNEDPAKFEAEIQRALSKMVKDVTLRISEDFDLPIVEYCSCLISLGFGCNRPL